MSSLYKATEYFSGPKGIMLFINDILTDRERIELGRRVVISSMILAGLTYFEINALLQISPNTYSAVRKWLDKQLPGYASVLELTKAEANAKVDKRKRPPYQHVDSLSFRAFKRKYPMHFLFFNIADEIISKMRK